MSSSTVQSLDATDNVTIRHYGIPSMSDIRLRVAGSDIQFNVHKQILAYHSTFFQHLIEADPQLTEIELVKDVPFSVNDLDLFLMAIYGECGLYLAESMPHGTREPHFHEDQMVQWRGVKCRVDHYRQGELVPLDQLEGEGQAPDWGQYRADEQALCVENRMRYVPYDSVDLGVALISPAIYCQASKLQEESTRIVVDHVVRAPTKQKLEWLIKFQNLNATGIVQSVVNSFSTQDVQTATTTEAALLDVLRPEMIKELMHKALRIPKRYLS